MKKLFLRMPEAFLAKRLKPVLEERLDFEVLLSADKKPEAAEELIISEKPELLLLYMTSEEGFGYCEQREICRAVRRKNINCKIAVLIDESRFDGGIQHVKYLKQTGLIDSFFYLSNDLEYITDSLEAL